MSAPPFTPDQIAKIVGEVLRRIRADLPRPAAAATVVASPPSAPPSPSAQAPQAPAPSAPNALTIPDKVVTGAALAGVPAGTRSVTVRTDAVITPSARDVARQAGFEIVRSVKGGGANPAAAKRPFFIAAAECPGDIAGRTAVLVRALPGAQQLPATGLADVVTALTLHLSRDGGRGLLLAGRPHAATALANRSAGVRAVTARDAAGLLAAAAECAANLLVVNPRDFSAVSLERAGVALANRPADAPPAELAPAGCPCGGGPKAGNAPSPCTCTTHAHH
jgi:hypothetical protein